MAQNSLKMYLSFQVAIDGNKQNVGNNSGRMVSDPSHQFQIVVFAKHVLVNM
jgi:hypothetical protein